MKQRQVKMVFRTHGGKRRGAGRKPKGKRSSERHKSRPEHDPRHPAHVTIRIVGNIGGLRRRDIYLALREATIVTATREDFRITHMSIQRDHIHLLVEADHKTALSKGVQGFSISAARQINKAITARGGDRRTGKVIDDRFHARPLTSPRAVRNAISYVRDNRPFFDTLRSSIFLRSLRSKEWPVISHLTGHFLRKYPCFFRKTSRSHGGLREKWPVKH